jgi:glycosyltransferase involved in cell wall biosynthesis
MLMQATTGSAEIGIGQVSVRARVAGTRTLTLDITRLLSRVHQATPTGIDRVELAYARALLSMDDRPVSFEAWLPGLGFVSYDRGAVAGLLSRLQASWIVGGTARPARVARALLGFRPGRPRGSDNLHLIVSHQHLADLGRRIRRQDGVRTCVYIHDTIPSDFPEYARPGGARTHDRRMRSSVALADALIVNSAATARSLERFMEEAGRRPQLLVAPLGVEPRFQDGQSKGESSADGRPYFLCIGTIEPRKNHLLLLQVWRAMAERMSADQMPRLILLGRRGWENENVIDMLERSTPLRGLVVEEGRVGDARLAALLANARALLMPSFAEGFGLPVAEALAAGVPVIASDIAVLRETGGCVPDYLDPLDGPAWMRAIGDYALEHSPQRAAQLQRMGSWKAPGWDEHFRQLLPFLDGI